ncbi:MAG: ABC transporter ATP-binding protein [Synechococcus sp.]|nr:ABC transporter ATP-binding protein [Synechococcus sp.]
MVFTVRLPQSQTLDQLRQLISTLPKSLRRQFYWLLPLAVLPGVLDILSVGILAQLMSSLLMSKAKRQIIPIHLPGSDRFEFVLILIGAFILVSWLRSLARLWLVISQEQYIERMWLYLTDHLYRGILGLPYEFHLGQDDSKLATQLLTNVTKVTRGILRPCLPLFSSFFSVVLLTGGILYVGRWYALGLFAGLTIAYGLFSVFMTPYLRHAERQKLLLASQMKQTFIDSMAMIREIRLYAAEDYYADSFRDKAQEAKKFEFLNTLLPWFPKLTIEPLGITLIFSFAIVPALFGGGFSDVKQVIPFLATLALASLRLTPALQETFASITKLRSGLPNISSLLKLMKLADEGADPSLVAGSLSRSSILPRRTIRLERISYSYPTANQPTISDLTLTIPVGSRVAFVGSTGSGKTTTGLLLLSLLTPQSGQLLIDGAPLEVQDRRAWQSCCSYVPQIVTFTRGSVLENIAFGEDPDQADPDAVWEALEAAQLADVVADLPYGLYTPIGRDGLRLSGGQRQRLALARAFYRRTEVLLLDEATSALDNKTESEVIEALEIIGRRCTTIVIAHRLSTIVRCDRIYEFEAGRIKASGNFEQLRAASSSFEELVATLERSLAAAS